jgi:hypothetical protein
MEILKYIVIVIGSLIYIYAAAKMVTIGVMKAKEQYNKRRNENGEKG